ncbi:hypothetical protein INP83_04705 [Mucilaginibacter sp. 21P]|uniref:hypothetical protein n=1 Tax=Mucilaginibacter sp. 21P TaxID=2778902 RepID=UPI001C584918|nr:hypothetical protein [Mucilaginibacter sp. 21P]QXV66387.1 hypothetical protein INP83_04705 [Mucilaginibacter sp. 21P]
MALRVKFYSALLLLLVVASFFHMQAVVIGVAIIIIAMPMERHVSAVKLIRLFAILIIPVVLGMFAGFSNNNYLILKDFYYFMLPVLFILAGILLACHLKIHEFLKVLVYAGLITSLLVTGISVYYIGVGSLTDPYSAHYAVGIVGTPGPPVALAILLLTKKFNIKLFSRFYFNLFVVVNAFGIYMCASRTYLIITLCFVMLLVADKLKRQWVLPVSFIVVVLVSFVPLDIFKPTQSSTSFIDKLLGSFNELSIGNYSTEEDINTKYRGYESFMALNQYMQGDTKDWIFGGLGKLVDLKTFLRLGEDTDYEFIPVLHNGWLYLLIKTGMLGIVTYAFVFIRLTVINWRKYANANGRPVIKLFAALSVGCILSLFLTNYIVTAFFNVEMSILMVTLGFSYLNFNHLLFMNEQRETAGHPSNQFAY